MGRNAPLRTDPDPMRCAVLLPRFRGRARRAREGSHLPGESAPLRSFGHRLEEAVALTGSLGVGIVLQQSVPMRRIEPGSFFGKGRIEEMRTQFEAESIGLAVVHASLSPVQQRVLEQRLQVKIIDRTGLILEIFGARARSREGKLQVELAALDYQRSRLVRSWTHLERQRGGFGFLGGPGESQLEMDRRLIEQRLRRIRSELETVRTRRALHRKGRERQPRWKVVSLVGYTNAGKTTLFNLLTGASGDARDQLFATLDPLARRARMGAEGPEILLVDTVGFISDLPAGLVAAFRATLEELPRADLIVHVRDIASDETLAQRLDVEKVLAGLDIEPDRVIEVLNKVDLLPGLSDLEGQGGGGSTRCRISARTGEGIDGLHARVRQYFLEREQDNRGCEV